MEQAIQLKIRSLIQHPGHEPMIEYQKVDGTLFKKARSTYIRYDDRMSGEVIQTTLKVSERELVIFRKGAVTMKLPLTIGLRRSATYSNHGMNMQLESEAERLLVRREEDQYSIDVTYHLYANEDKLGTYELALTYTEATK